MIAPIRFFPADVARNLFAIFFDIDDTFTTHGKIPGNAFQALWLLKESGIKAVPITGRPAGWCDHIARMWPVDGVVGENGALYFWYDEKGAKLSKRFADPDDIRRENRRRLEMIREEILASVPGTAVASDQPYRESDLAIDYCEDVPALGWKEVEEICEIFKHYGAACKISSIHVNGWFGNYDKLRMTRVFVSERWGMELDEIRERFLFCGDSPNDEPMFKYFPHTAGVKNILRFAERMRHMPAFVADHEGGEGFAQIVQAILSMRPAG
jgi:HAD superfamily hydrolase (TIGR01484 family)